MKTKQKCNVTGNNNFEKENRLFILQEWFWKRGTLKGWLAVPESSFQFTTKVIYQNVLLFKSFKRVEARNKNGRFISFHFVWKESWQTTEKDPYPIFLNLTILIRIRLEYEMSMSRNRRASQSRMDFCRRITSTEKAKEWFIFLK